MATRCVSPPRFQFQIWCDHCRCYELSHASPAIRRCHMTSRSASPQAIPKCRMLSAPSGLRWPVAPAWHLGHFLALGHFRWGSLRLPKVRGENAGDAKPLRLHWDALKSKWLRWVDSMSCCVVKWSDSYASCFVGTKCHRFSTHRCFMRQRERWMPAVRCKKFCLPIMSATYRHG